MNKTEVATITGQLLAGIQAVLDSTNRGTLVLDKAWHLEQKRTVGMVVPQEFVDYHLFVPDIINQSTNKLIIVPTIDNWAVIQDNFNHETRDYVKFRIFNETGEVIDCYQFGSRAHLKLARLLKIDPSVKEIVKVSSINFMVNGRVCDTPRGFSFELQAEKNGFVVKQLMARYLGRVQMFNEVSHSVTHDRAIIPQLDETEPRVEMDLVVIYESRKFFDRVRKAKFYTWLATQAKDNTKVILIN